MKGSKTVDDYVVQNEKWAEELTLLREIILKTNLEETIKWGGPSYTHEGKMIVGMGAFKNFVSLWFYQGVFLKDDEKKLINAQENVTKGLRQWRFKSAADIKSDSKIIKAYIEESIKNEKAGKHITPDRKKPLIIPHILQEMLEQDTNFSDKFNSFSVAKQREFADYISQAKWDNTKVKRLEKITPLIQKGIGLNDQYKKKQRK